MTMPLVICFLAVSAACAKDTFRLSLIMFFVVCMTFIEPVIFGTWSLPETAAVVVLDGCTAEAEDIAGYATKIPVRITTATTVPMTAGSSIFLFAFSFVVIITDTHFNFRYNHCLSMIRNFVT